MTDPTDKLELSATITSGSSEIVVTHTCRPAPSTPAGLGACMDAFAEKIAEALGF